MDFNLELFTRRLKELIRDNMPCDNETIHIQKKHGSHIRDIALEQNSIIPVGLDSMYFEIGNEKAERERPSYHILEDSEVISKRGKATKKTKGSQDLIKDKGKRDYGIATFSYTKNRKSAKPYYEYRKNVRGKRSLISKSQTTQYASGNKVEVVNRNSKYYKNVNYHYIERTLDITTPFLAQEFGLKLKRTKIDNTEEYSDFLDNLLSIGDTYFDDIEF